MPASLERPQSASVATPPVMPARYEPRTLAGSGSFGEVWRVFDRWHGQECAAKFLSAEHRAHEWRERFFREFALLYRLRHPGLVTAFDYSRTKDNTPFFTMDWVAGPTLEGGHWSHGDRLRIAWELLDTLGFLHRQGVIHADIKSANIKVDIVKLHQPLDSDGNRALTLLDFGLTVDARMEEENARRGTVHYMAPEWFKPGEVDFRIDLYSMGVLLFELWAGRPPFDGTDPLVVIRQHIEATPPELSELVPDIPSPISDAVSRLLAKQPEIRDKGAAILSDYVAEQLGAEPSAGLSALRYHFESLGHTGKSVSLETLDSWLGHGHPARILYLRGGVGLDQHHILQGLVPDICRYGHIPWLIEDIRNPLPQDPGLDLTEIPLVPLIAVSPDHADQVHRFLRLWNGTPVGMRHVAVSLEAEVPANRGLALELATQVRNDLALLVPVGCMEDSEAHQRVQQMLGPSVEGEAERAIVRRAVGNSARLRALASDHLVSQNAGDPTEFSVQLAHEQRTLPDATPAEELSAMSLFAVAQSRVSRETLRSLADIPWDSALSRWLDLGLAGTEDGLFWWSRPDWRDTLLRSLPDARHRIIHRAWAEYWGSDNPEPGTPPHEFLVYHLLRSDLYRQAVRTGLESAKHWTAQHQAQKALEVLDEVVKCLKHVPAPAPSLVFEIAVAQAEARRVLAHYADALAGLQEALSSSAVQGHAQREALIYKKIGDLYKSLKQSAAGKTALQEALIRYRRLNDRVEVSHVLNNLGNIHFVAGEFEDSIASFQEALALQRESNLPRDIASTLNNIGAVRLTQSRYGEAIAALSEAVDIKRILHDPEELARSLNNLGVVFLETGNYAHASEKLRESYGINVAAGKSGEQLFNLQNLAVVAHARGDWSEAIAHCEGGLRLTQARDQSDGRPPFLLVIAGIALAQGNYDQIAAPLYEAEQILRNIEDAYLTLQAMLLQAECAFWRGQYDRALAGADQTSERAGQEGMPVWRNRAELLKARSHLHIAGAEEKARGCLDSVLSEAERLELLPEQIHAHILIGEMETIAHRLDAAAEHLRKCEPLLLECSAKPMFLPFSNALGHYYEKRGDLELALSIFDTARKLAKNLTYLEWLWHFHASCGHILLRQKNYEAAVDQYRGGLVILEHLVSKLPEQDRDQYVAGSEKVALGEGLQVCHQAIVRTKK